MVWAVAGVICSRFAQPKPSSHAILPSFPTATAIAATFFSCMNDRIVARTPSHRSGGGAVWAAAVLATRLRHSQPRIMNDIPGDSSDPTMGGLQMYPQAALAQPAPPLTRAGFPRYEALHVRPSNVR